MTQGISMKLIPALILVAFAGTAGAAGFALQNQTGSGNGNAFAGAAAAAEDAGTIYFNPAGMTYLPEGHSVAVAGTVLQRSVKFSDTGTAALPTFTLGSDGGDAGGTKLIPAAYYAYSISPSLRVGLGISPTYGNKTEYKPEFIGRFSGYTSEIKQININPSIAYRVSDKISLGFGLNYAKSELEFNQMVVVGAGTQRVGNLKGDDSAWGYNLGGMFQLSPSTRVGLSYRSKIKFQLDGTQDVQGVVNRAIRSELTTPDTFSMAVSQQLSERWEMLGDLTWTGWSSVKSLPVISASTGGLITSLDYNFKNTWRVGLGANYKLNDAWKLRFGVAHDKTPVPSDADRTMTLPDADRTWLSFGARFALSRISSLDMGYSHIFFKDVSTARSVTTGVGTQIIRGKFDTSADLLSLQYNQTF